ncbi:MAG: Protein translocase subunit SecY [Firmicutes bacterium]|nr:Protein translocase subunit SecY [candidate division NPL-UPA2 bacterium]MBT9153550.1 Protein translocase subunit SecY [candidate division NPL-UPA2 bacterium]
MLASLRNIWRIEELRKRIMYTLGVFLIIRFGNFIPVPGADRLAMAQFMEGQGGLFGLLDVISGGALANLSIFTLTIGPYITSSIIVSLLQVVIPSWEALAKEGEEGRKKLNSYTRYGTVILAFVQGYATSIGLANEGALMGGQLSALLTATSFTAGATMVMWLGELITEKGVGNGISLVIFANIASQLPGTLTSMIEFLREGTLNIFTVVLLGALTLVVTAGVVWVQEGQRRIPVQYAKRVVGRKMYGGQTTHIPLRVNQAGVIPVIFASSLLMFPQVITQFTRAPWVQGIAEALAFGGWLHNVLYVFLIFVFSYFYTFLQFNPKDMAENMQKHGGAIPGVRPGRTTADFLFRVVNRLTLVGSAFLALIVILPLALSGLVRVNVGIGGTALLIVVGVALETMKQIEGHLVMRNYRGFMK